MSNKDMIKDSLISINREDHQEKDSLETTIIHQEITINPENTIKESRENINIEIQIINHKAIEEKISMRREPTSNTITKGSKTTSNNSKDIRLMASNKPTSSKDTNKDIKLKDISKLINSKVTKPKDISNIKQIMKNNIYGINSTPKLGM